jgi:hypothetical protein
VATDAESGINPTSVGMVLSNGLTSASVPASFDPSSGVVSYQVPTTIKGARLGQFPLPDGTYTARVQVNDRAGNSASTTWSFVVHTLPV